MNFLSASLVLGFELVINLYLSSIFIFSVYNQYKFVKRALYKSLLQDGIIFSLSTTLISVLMMILVVCQVLGDNSAVLFNISWTTASFLTTTQLRHSLVYKKKAATNTAKDSNEVSTSSSATYNNSSSNNTLGRSKDFTTVVVKNH